MKSEKVQPLTVRKFQERLDDLVEEKRNSSKVSNAQMAQEIGIRKSSLSKYMNSEAEAGIHSLVKIAKYFNVSTDYLLGLSEDKTTDTNIKIACHTTGLSDSSIIACQSLDELPREIINTLLLQPTFKEVLYRIFVVAGEKSVCQHLEQEVERTKTSSLTTPAELTLKKCAIPTLEQEEYQLNKYLHTLIVEAVESLCSKNKAVSEYGKNGSGNLLRNSGFNGGQEK